MNKMEVCMLPAGNVPYEGVAFPASFDIFEMFQYEQRGGEFQTNLSV